VIVRRQKLFAEAFGTFCLVFAGTGAITVNEITHGQVTGLGIGLVFGLVVLSMVYALGHISGAHLNPAVTLGFYSAGRHPGREVVPYLVAQVCGAVSASICLRLIFLGSFTSLGMTQPAGSAIQSAVLEYLLTFILMFVILSVATGDRAEGIMAGVAIGATIGLEAIFAGPICGASMNPARSFAPALISMNFSNQWIYWLGPILGSISGAVCYKSIQS
jgi:aquaporin Z